MSRVPENIISVSLINHQTGEEFKLEEKNGSYCHFLAKNNQIPHDNNYLRFRLDWKDLGPNGDPTLDADIVNNEGRQYKERVAAHHTDKLFEPACQKYAYHFIQGTIDIIFVTQITKQATQIGTAYIIQANSNL